MLTCRCTRISHKLEPGDMASEAGWHRGDDRLSNKDATTCIGAKAIRAHVMEHPHVTGFGGGW